MTKATLDDTEIKCMEVLDKWYREHGHYQYMDLEALCKELNVEDARVGRSLMSLMIGVGVMERIGDDKFRILPEIIWKNRDVQNQVKESNKPKDVVTQTWNYIRSRKVLAIPLMIFLGLTAILTLVASVATLLDKLGLLPKN